MCSDQAKKRERHTLDKYIEKESNSAIKSFKKLSRQLFACAVNAKNSLKIGLKSHHEVAITDSEIVKHNVFKQSGRPS
ncbi:hypothetical protein CJF42_19360 [Pseudoalteromonas sp. NBT06-2]|nr:hypothetical protein CJF42_19360 [Pseudoalteromonas sp. NBT06-2]